MRSAAVVGDGDLCAEGDCRERGTETEDAEELAAMFSFCNLCSVRSSRASRGSWCLTESESRRPSSSLFSGDTGPLLALSLSESMSMPALSFRKRNLTMRIDQYMLQCVDHLNVRLTRLCSH